MEHDALGVFAHPSPLPFQVPDFSHITPEICVKAIRAAVDIAEERWDQIAHSSSAPTIDNTLVPLEYADTELHRAETAFYTMVSAMGGDEWDQAERDLIPVFVRHSSVFTSHKDLYQRLRALRATFTNDEAPQSGYLLDEYLRDFQREGIDLSDEDHRTLRALEEKIATAEQRFTQLVTRSRTEAAWEGTDASATGVSLTSFGGTVNQNGSFSVPLVNTTHHPLLSVLPRAKDRHALLEASLHRSDGTGSIDTRDIVHELATLREEKAHILGFASFADFAVDDLVAPDVESVRDVLVHVGQHAKATLEREYKQLHALAQNNPALPQSLEASDWLFVQEKQRTQLIPISSEELSHYLELDRVLGDGVFYAATRLYGITFHPRDDIPLYDDSLRAWEVHDEGGETLGLFIVDPYTRATKQGGAWMHELVDYDETAGDLPVIMNTYNFNAPQPGEPTLLSWDDVETCFHEFGHALHGLLTRAHYPSAVGTRVPEDFVEFPSQLNEMWAYHPEVMARFLRHHDTGLPPRREVVDAMVSSRTFGQAFATLEYVAASLIDLQWHTTPHENLPDSVGIADFERETLEEYGVYSPLVAPRYRSTYFTHTFGGGYASTYSSYMWAELMVAGLEDWIRRGPYARDNEGLNRETGQRIRDEILSRGNSRAPMDSYMAVTGKAPDRDAIVRRRGLM